MCYNLGVKICNTQKQLVSCKLPNTKHLIHAKGGSTNASQKSQD